MQPTTTRVKLELPDTVSVNLTGPPTVAMDCGCGAFTQNRIKTSLSFKTETTMQLRNDDRSIEDQG
jgi:hypothetical protein